MSLFAGLSQAEASRLLASYGPNDIRVPKKMAWLRRLWEVLSEPTLLVLVLVLIFYISLGSMGEAALLAAFVFIVISITYVEEARTEKAVSALSAFASPRALALRDGQWLRVGGLEIVPGDLLNLNEGDRVPADAEILEAHDLKVDESLLTGESQAVWKDLNGSDRMAWAGSMILQGQAVARVTATGLKTKVGLLSRSLSEIEPEDTPFQRSTSDLVKALGLVALVACLSVVGFSYLRGSSLVEAILEGLTLAIATVPEELPVILAVFLAMGARRLSKHGVLATKVSAVETLGAVTLLAVDKTGTLTRNEMFLTRVLPLEGVDEKSLLKAAAEASETDPFDPMERQILKRAGAVEGSLTHEYALSGRPPRMGHVWDATRLAVKGAVEGVLEHCIISEQAHAAALKQAKLLASQGLRVLGVAAGRLEGPAPEELPKGLVFLGLLAFEDPLREGVKEAIATARSAGMRVVMMTGDSVETAAAISKELGLLGAERVISGVELEKSPEKIPELSKEVNVFARMAPEQKLSLVQAWTALGEVVGMTGDGVNDAPALMQAHVGIGLGQRGTDVAREAADLVLTNDSFNSLVEGVRVGRGTTARILQAALFVLAVHVPIIGLVLACLFFGLPPLITAAQIAFLELFIGPTCSVVFERAAEEPGLMSRPPRDPQAPLLSFKGAAYSLVQGLVIFALVLIIYVQALGSGSAPDHARSIAFITLMIADLMLCWTLLSRQPFYRWERWSNGAYWLVSAAVMGLLALLLWLPWTSSIFHMRWLELGELGRCALWAALAVLWHESTKFGRKR